MTITCDTNLESILNSEKVEALLEFSINIRKNTEQRAQNLSMQIETEAIQGGLINDENIMYTTGVEVKNAFENFHSLLLQFEGQIRALTITKEREELEELIAALNKKIDTLEERNRQISNQIDSTLEPNKAVQLEKESNRIYNDIKTYSEKRTAALNRLNSLVVPDTAAVGGELTDQSMGASLRTIDDPANGTSITFDEYNPGARILTYKDENGNTITATYTYDQYGRPQCTYVDGEGNTTVYGVDEFGSMSINGEHDDGSSGKQWQYVQIADTQTGATIEVPIVTETGGCFYSMNTPNTMNGDYSYVHHLAYGSCTTDNVLPNPSEVNRPENIFDEEGNPIIDVTFSFEQEFPYGYQIQESAETD